MPRLRYDPAHDYYHLLGVPASASAGDIQRAFHRLAKELHPDRNPERSDWAKQRFQTINEAYTVLGNPARRQAYDRERWPYVRQEERRSTRFEAAGRAYDPAKAQGAAPGTAWNYGDWVRHTPPPPPPQPAMPARASGAVLTALLRGPFGSIYLILLLSCLMLPVSYLAVTSWVNHVVSQPAAPATATCTNPDVTITQPAAGANVAPVFTVSGVANPPDFAAYRLEIAELPAAQSWTLLHSSQIPVINGALAPTVDLSAYPHGDYLLRLTVQLTDGARLPACEQPITR